MNATGRFASAWGLEVAPLSKSDPWMFASRLEQLSRAWAEVNGLELESAVFAVYAKDTGSVEPWRAGRLRGVLIEPWTKVGEGRWQDGRLVYSPAP